MDAELKLEVANMEETKREDTDILVEEVDEIVKEDNLP